MTDYIKREDALKIINDMTENEDDYRRCTNMINELPSADVRENVRAEKSISGGIANCNGATCWFECSACGGSVDISDNFCKHCGADMRGDKS